MQLRLILVFVIAAAVFSVGWLALNREPKQLTTSPEPVHCITKTTTEQFTAADIIMIGKVVGVLPAREFADVWMTPQKVYRGEAGGTNVKIVARPREGEGTDGKNTLNDLHFTSNDPPYLLYLRARPDGRYDTSRCDGSRLLGEGLTTEEKSILTPEDLSDTNNSLI